MNHDEIVVLEGIPADFEDHALLYENLQTLLDARESEQGKAGQPGILGRHDQGNDFFEKFKYVVLLKPVNRNGKAVDDGLDHVFLHAPDS